MSTLRIPSRQGVGGAAVFAAVRQASLLAGEPWDPVVKVAEGSASMDTPTMDGGTLGALPKALRDRDLDLATLVGCTEQDARAQVEAAGGQLRCYDDDHPWLTLDYRPTRVTARIEDSRVVEVHGFS